MQTRGILHPEAIGRAFTLARHAPAADLSEVVDRFWVVRWSLPPGVSHEQETLPYPCVNAVVGTHRPGVFGPMRERFVARLAGDGWVVGAKLRPAGFRGLTDEPMSAFVDRERTFGDALRPGGRALERAMLQAPDDATRVAHFEAHVRAHHRGVDGDDREANRVVELARTDATVTRVDALAARAGVTVRTLERLFRATVGVSPKWVIRRFRVQEAAERLAAGGAVDCPGLAHDLGYFDQAHFIRDFKSQVGKTPGAYARAASTPADAHAAPAT